MTQLKKDTDAKTAAEKKRLEKQAQEQAKLDAIEAKIEKARIRQEETKKQKAQKAVATRIKLTKGPGNGSLPPKNPKRLGARDSHNDDLDFVLSE